MQQSVVSFLLYCFVSGITPGPANLLSLATALTHGKQVALRQWRGLFAGFWVVALLSAAAVYFVGKQLEAYLLWFRWIGAVYILWLALHLLRDAWRKEDDPSSSAPARNGFLTGFLTQLGNVKIMVFCVTALMSFVLPYTSSLWQLLLTAAFLPFTGPVCNLVWLFAGAQMQTIFSRYKRPIGIIMAIALVGCAVSILL